ncbi:MAG TPA: hypothetical protein DEA31_02910 [Alphaproteobacteria bacterium]|nr:hypothetical protein [Alphaproteobacteria bacterium]
MSINKCAIYVRKSTEHGLDMEFNSLQNQEESCLAYIASQSFNGWKYCKTYTDAAISGGTMERPALKQMLDDMAHGLINTVVVYKVDRLSRSILDFHNMMKYFEKYGVNFVSITQSFDTSNSMGKLTLNMLLSFAQFEREVAGERVRDKIRASKAKGIWVGGNPRLGYDIINKKLVVNKTEADTVKLLFNKYLELQSVALLKKFANANNIHNKQWTTKTGKIRGGRPFQNQTLLNLLHDKIYIGIMECKSAKTSAPGEHTAIIATELFNRVQAALRNNTNGKFGNSHNAPNLLTGKLFNDDGIKFTNQQTRQQNKQTKYYYAIPGLYIQSSPVDEIVINIIDEFMNANLERIHSDFGNALKHIDFSNLPFPTKRDFIRRILQKVIYSKNKLTLFIDQNADIKEFINTEFTNENQNKMDYVIGDKSIIVRREFIMQRYNKRNDYNAGKSAAISISDNNHLVVRAFARAFKYRKMYEECGDYKSIAKMENTSESSVYRHLKLAYMHPDTVNAIMSGTMQCSVDKLFNIQNNL